MRSLFDAQFQASRAQPDVSLKARRDRVERLQALLETHLDAWCEAVRTDFGVRSRELTEVADLFVLRAMIGITIFYGAYMAETIRGGLQAMPRGQFEAASALGLNYWKSTIFIILPQALRYVIPGIVGTFISLVKDTSLVSIIGLLYLINAINAAGASAEWASPTKAFTGYAFAIAIYFVLCFSLSRYAKYMENRLNTGHKR